MTTAHVETVRRLHATAVQLSTLLRLRQRLLVLRGNYGAELLLVEVEGQVTEALALGRN